MENIQTKCLQLLEIERFVVNESLLGDKKESFKTHLEYCLKCQRRYGELKSFYLNLKDEMLKPISPKVFSLVRQIEDYTLDTFYFVLKPSQESDNQKKPDNNSFLFSKIDHRKDSLVDLYQTGAIILCMIHKKSTQQTCFAIWTREPKLYRNVKLYFREKKHTFLSDEIGLIKAGSIDPEGLDGQLVNLLFE